MRFTSEEAFEAHEDGEPIMIEHAAAVAIVLSHGSDDMAFTMEVNPCEPNLRYDAWDVLLWLGY